MAFVGDVDDRLVGQFDFGRRHQERDTLVPVGVDDGYQLLGGDLQNTTQAAQALRPADAAALRFLDRQRLEHSGAQLFAADASGDDVASVTVPGRLALVVGNEGAGLSAEARARADRVVALPLAPGVESLNVAVATGILLHTLTK